MTDRPADSDPPVNWNRRLLALTGPIVVANLSVPLPGLVDTAVMGHQPEAAGLAAVGLGAMIFATLFFTFGFLRMSTVGLTAQADGAGDHRDIRAVLYRGGALALIIAAALLLAHQPLGRLAFGLTDAAPRVVELGLAYYDIRVWGAPAALLNMAILGWLFGLGHMRAPVVLQIVTNLINVALDFLFVFGFDWGIEGVAAATVIAEWSGTLLGIVIVARRLRPYGGIAPPPGALTDWAGMRRLLGVNRDIFIRTLCLLIAFAHFKFEGATLGTTTLAANIVLLTFLDISSYGLDAFANAAEILVGKAVGRRDASVFRKVVRLAHLWGFAIAGISAVVFYGFGAWIVGVLTNQPQVLAEADRFMVWAAILPLTAVWAFVIDGVFVGGTWSAALRNGMIAAIAVYFAAQWLLVPAYGNEGLWLALHIFLVARGVTLGIQYPGLVRRLEGQKAGVSR
ncbi:MAG: MATE family efflux transporter [Alphaproteobacteria bacterium]|nr:MATE family efflux transporter [Alphaproteobacteria bacterium]MBO6863915.1 MATE family efflux transporter [Alphaproteobacteria bacterium]